MKPTSVVTLVLVTLAGVGTAYLLNASEARLPPWPKSTPPPPPSPIYTPSTERVQTEEEIALLAQGHNQMLEREIESALQGNDPQQRETVFTFLLPELIQVEPDRVVSLVARQPPGKARTLLRTEVAQQWIARDAAAAVAWMKSLDDEERRASAAAAVASIAGYDPVTARALAIELGLGRKHVSMTHN
jgi:hypothetical protein